MEQQFLTFQELIKKYNLNDINYTYLNRKSLDLLSNDDSKIKIRIGENYILWLLRLFNITDLSNVDNFDFSGFARLFFQICQQNQFSIAIYGGKVEEIKKFTNKISNEFNLNLVDSASGYLRNEFYIDRIKTINPDIVLIGLGNPKQNILLTELSKLSITGIFTCGAFISQESNTYQDYYESSNLPRWIVRSMNEKGHFFRVIYTSITSLVTIIKYKYLR